LQAVGERLPTAALSHGLRMALTRPGGLDGSDLLVLVGWAVIALTAAARTFRWEA
jgi:ABC-2 type transport system permease protein